MDLTSVKAAVKAWEKSFVAAHGRKPTKEDVKSDPGDIGQSSRGSTGLSMQRFE